MAGASGTEEDDYLYSEDLYVNLPEDKFSCPICLCPVQREAHLTGCCGKHFCFKCISRVKNGNKPCPMCNATPVAIFPNKERQREVNQVEVHCPLNTVNAAGGECVWKGELGSAKHHVVEKHGTGALRRLNGMEENQETQLAANLCRVVDLGGDGHTCDVSAQHTSVCSTTFPPVPVSTSAPHTPSLTPHSTTPPHTPPTEEPQPRHPYPPHPFRRCHPHSPPHHHPPHHHPPHHHPPDHHPHHLHPPHPHLPHHFPHRPHFSRPHHPPHGQHFPHRPPHPHHPHPHHHHPLHFPHRPPHPHPHLPHHCKPRHPFP